MRRCSFCRRQFREAKVEAVPYSVAYNDPRPEASGGVLWGCERCRRKRDVRVRAIEADWRRVAKRAA